MKGYIAYYRKSTDSEDRQVLSLDGQQEAVRGYAQRQNLKIVEEIRESFSAKKPGRPKFSDMIHRAKGGRFSGVIAYKLDRLTRNYADLGALAELIEQGVEIHDTSFGVYKDDSNSFIMIGVNTAIASAKIKGLSEDTRRGLRQKREMGWFPGYAPTGYVNNRIDKTIDIDPERAPYIRKAYELYDSGQYPLKELAMKLYRDGFRVRTNSDHIPKTTLEQILKNPFYYGCFRNKDVLFEGKHTPLVSKELWDRVQDRLSGKAQRKGGIKHVYTYRGFLTCSECGCSITAEKRKGHIYYRCTKSRGKCGQLYIREEELEVQLAGIFDSISIDRQTSEFIHAKLKELYDRDRAYQAKVTKRLRIKLTRLKLERRRLFRKMINDRIDDREMYDELREEIDSQIADIGRQMARLSQSTHDWLEQSWNLLELSRQAKKLFFEANIEGKRKLLESVSSDRVLKDRKVHFNYKKPFDILFKGRERTNWLGTLYDLRTFFTLNVWENEFVEKKKVRIRAYA